MDSDGRARGEEFLAELSEDERYQVRALFEYAADTGVLYSDLRYTDEDGTIQSFKVGTNRFLCFIDDDDVVITHGFRTRRKRAEPSELAVAYEIRNTYLRAQSREAETKAIE